MTFDQLRILTVIADHCYFLCETTGLLVGGVAAAERIETFLSSQPSH